MTPTHHEIAVLAYALWQRNGIWITTQAEADHNWYEAEKILRGHHKRNPTGVSETRI
jgi:hypothetical protein